MSAPRRRKKRVRRSAEQARELILDAAEKRLAVGGPAGIRLQEVAADAGISHPTILHHFGSREGLVEAVCQRALDTMQRDAAAAFVAEQFEEADAKLLLRKILALLADKGHARLLAWLALEGRTQEDPAYILRELAQLMHARRLAETGRDAPQEDTLFVIVLASLALLGEGILGTATWNSAGLAEDPRAPDRFHAWLVDLLGAHLRR